jgi:hypothetical protein
MSITKKTGLESGAASAAHTASDTARRATETLSSAARSATDTVALATKSASDAVDRIVGDLEGPVTRGREWVEKYPITSLALLLAAGYVVRRALSRAA